MLCIDNRMMKMIFLFFLFCSNLQAELVDHLKKAEGKTGIHQMRNIDFIYMINLDKRPEKFLKASSELLRFGINPYRFSAVNGWELSLEAINDVGLKFQEGMTPLMASVYPLEAGGKISYEFMTEIGKTYFCHRTALGTLGCSLSHISVLKDAWEAGYDTIWVLEDDIEVVSDPNKIADLIDELDRLVGKNNWDVLFTDQNYRTDVNKYLIASGAQKRPDMDCSVGERYSEKYTTNEIISPNFKKVSARFATHSMIIRRCGIEKLLKYSLEHKIYLPYDQENYFAPELKRYSFTFDVVSNMFNSVSDNAEPTYKQ